MASRLALAVLGAFSISLLAIGSGQAAVCDPHCSPSSSSQSNQGGDKRGLQRANERAGVHGADGRAKAALNPGNYKQPTGGSGGDTGGSTGGDTGGSTGGDTGGDTGGGGTPCTGC